MTSQTASLLFFGGSGLALALLVLAFGYTKPLIDKTHFRVKLFGITVIKWKLQEIAEVRQATYSDVLFFPGRTDFRSNFLKCGTLVVRSKGIMRSILVTLSEGDFKSLVRHVQERTGAETITFRG